MVDIRLKKSSVPGKVPVDSALDFGELAINYADGRLYFKNSGGTIKNFVDSDIVTAKVSAATVDNLVGGTGVTYDSATSTISIGQAVGTTDNVTFALATLDSANVDVINFGITDNPIFLSTEGTVDSNIAVLGLSGSNSGFKIQSAVTGPGDNGTTFLSMNSTGRVHITNATEATSKTNASVTLLGGLGVDKTIRSNDVIAVNNIRAGTNGTGKFIGDLTGTVSTIANHTTDSLGEGSLNLYYTVARFDSDFGTKSTTDLAEGNNLYYTSARSDSDARNAITVSDAGGDGSLTYSAATGVITYTGPSATEVRSHFSAGTGVTLTGGQISIGQSVGTGDSVEFASLITSGDIVVNGDLTVAGSFTQNTVTDLSVTNAMIRVADSNSADNVDIGIIGRYSDDGGTTIRRAGFIRDASNGEWYAFQNLVQDGIDSSEPDQTVNVNDPTFELGTWNFGKLRGTYLGFDSDFAAFSSDYTVIDSDYSAQNADRLALDTSGGTFTVTLPPSPTTGTYVRLIDVGNWSTTPVTVGRNGSTIEGFSDDFSLDVGQNIIEFIYINSTWNVYASIGQRGPEGPQGPVADSGDFASTNESIAFAIALG